MEEGTKLYSRSNRRACVELILFLHFYQNSSNALIANNQYLWLTKYKTFWGTFHQTTTTMHQSHCEVMTQRCEILYDFGSHIDKKALNNQERKNTFPLYWRHFRNWIRPQDFGTSTSIISFHRLVFPVRMQIRVCTPKRMMTHSWSSFFTWTISCLPEINKTG